MAAVERQQRAPFVTTRQEFAIHAARKSAQIVTVVAGTRNHGARAEPNAGTSIRPVRACVAAPTDAVPLNAGSSRAAEDEGTLRGIFLPERGITHRRRAQAKVVVVVIPMIPSIAGVGAVPVIIVEQRIVRNTVDAFRTGDAV